MTHYHDASNPCITAESRVRMADGTEKSACTIRRGDCVKAPCGQSACIECVLETRCAGVAVAYVSDVLAITPFHPVRRCGTNQWTLPGGLVDRQATYTGSIFSFLLCGRAPSVLVGDFEVVALAHGLDADIARHAYYGTERVVGDMRQHPSWESGLIVLHEPAVLRDCRGEPCGMAFARAQPVAPQIA